MTTLMWEVAARADVADVTAWVAAELWPWLAGTRAFVGGELYSSTDDPAHVVVVAHWADAAGAEAAERGLRSPERQPGAALVTRPPNVWSFRRVPRDAPSRVE